MGNIGLAFGWYHAAGVLPYAVGADGTLKFLLGLSSVHHNQASDFGGLQDEIDKNNPQKTAAREGCEELMFIFDKNLMFEKILESYNKYKKLFDLSKIQSVSYNQLLTAIHKAHFSISNNYIMYFINIPYQKNLPDLFKQRKANYKELLSSCWDETVRLVWVDVDELFDAINNRSHFGSVIIKDFSLYEPFVKSLVAARSQNIISNINAQRKIFTHKQSVR